MISDPSAVGFGRLTRRADYVSAARGSRHHAALLSIQMIERPLADQDPPRFGLTVSRKVGTAVERNRVKRRLRSVLRDAASVPGRPGHDYVIVARRDLLHAPFPSIVVELASGIERLHRPRRPGADRPAQRRVKTQTS
jgi:ribonuclease P protein component